MNSMFVHTLAKDCCGMMKIQTLLNAGSNSVDERVGVPFRGQT